MRNSKNKSLLVVIVATTVLVIGLLSALWILVFSSSSEQESVTYTNEKYGYQIMATEKDGRILEENLLVIEADVPAGADTNPGGESRIFYFNDIGFKNQLGIVSCYETYQPWDGLSNEMPLQEYAQTLYDMEMAAGPGPNYDRQLVISDLHPTSVDDEEAYTYVYGREGDDIVDVMSATITENPEGKKCWIRYSVTDHHRGFDTKMLEQRTHWFNSFTWIK